MVGQDPPLADSAAAVPAPQQRRRRRWKVWTVLAAVLVLLAGGAITAVAVSFHYLHAPGLEAVGSVGWLPPDDRRTRLVQDEYLYDGYDVLVIPARPKQWQTFSVQVHNPSSVTQTILGQAGGSGATAEPERLTVSTTSTATGDPMRADYAPEPVGIPPDGTRTVRLSHYPGGCWIWGHGNGRGEIFTYLLLRVRVGAFTRTERIDFRGQALELRGTGGVC